MLFLHPVLMLLSPTACVPHVELRIDIGKGSLHTSKWVEPVTRETLKRISNQSTYSLLMKAYLLMVSITSLNRILDVKV